MTTKRQPVKYSENEEVVAQDCVLVESDLVRRIMGKVIQRTSVASFENVLIHLRAMGFSSTRHRLPLMHIQEYKTLHT
jgi:hypothetical protein